MRIPQDEFYMKLAYSYAEQSTCLRRKVGAVIVRDGRQLSAGYNGAPPKIAHCTPDTCIRTKLNIQSGQQQELCLAGDTVVKLLDGTYKTIQELAEKGEDVWVYSININTGEIVPGYAINPHLTGYRDDIVEITFDNGKSIKCTSDHKILLRDCTYKKAKDLVYGDSCMPIYYNKGKDNNSHEVIRNTTKDGRIIKKELNWKCKTKLMKTHEMVYRNFNDFREPLGKNIKDIHHKDENKFNNAPENLVLLTKSEHVSIHGGFLNWDKEKHKQVSIKGGQKISELAKIARESGTVLKSLSDAGKKSMTNNWNNPDFRNKMLIINKENAKKIAKKYNSDPKAIEARNIGKIQKGLSYLIFKCNENNENITLSNYEQLRNKYKLSYKTGDKGQSPPTLKYVYKYYNSLEFALQEANYYNHKVVSVKYLNEKQVAVYDLSVPEYENFAIDLGDNSCVISHNCRGGHAEQNAIANAAENGVAIKGSTLYCTTQPCLYCAKAIVRAGIVKIVYCEPYANGMDELTKEILQNVELKVFVKKEITNE